MAEQAFTSGDWVVKEGNQEDFEQRWADFTNWSKKNADGCQGFWLIRDKGDPHHYVSFGAWSGSDAVDAWRASPEFSTRVGAVRELCDEFEAGDYLLAVQVM